LQYLHQLGALQILPALVKTIIVPESVEAELNAGLKLGLSLPSIQALDWVTVRRPSSSIALPLVTDLGPGEREVLALALEMPDSVCILDDALARQVAKALHIRVTGTLGILINAKRSGIIPAVRPLLDQLQGLGFRVAAHTRAAVLDLVGEPTE
jgi:hypothetical protein